MTQRRLLSPRFVLPPLSIAILATSASAAGDASRTAISFICKAERQAGRDAGPRRLAIEGGMGAGGFAIPTRSPEAQAWFNYGMVLLHAFYHGDAKLAFDKAVAADPDCAMCRLGQAISRGPTQNFDLEPDEVKAALDLAKTAQAAARTPAEKIIGEALVKRYEAKPDAKAEVEFAAALQRAFALEPTYVDLPLIAAGARLTAYRRGDKAEAAATVALLEPILRREPDNVGAIHYYIHATEFAGRPEDALPYARRLAGLAPKASHLIHMAAHTFLPVGLYEDAAAVNAAALDVDTEHAKATGVGGPLGKPDYYPHNLTFGMGGALMAGDSALALKFADHTPLAFPPGARPNTGYLFGRSYVAYGRFAPARALSLPAPPAGDMFRSVMWRYGRGEAFAAQGDAAAIRAERAAMVAGMGEAPKTYTATTGPLEIGRRVLDGRAAMLEGRPMDAARIFAEAADFQDSMGWGRDPPPWWYPVRRSQAAALLKAGDAQGAAKAARASLAKWPKDGLALWVLSQAEQRLGDAKQAGADLAAAKVAWRGDLRRMRLDLI